MKIEPRTGEIEVDGEVRRIAYHTGTVFKIQVGKGSKGSYRNKYTVTGNLTRAVHLYNGINIGNGYKKRMVQEGANPNPIILKATS